IQVRDSRVLRTAFSQPVLDRGSQRCCIVRAKIIGMLPGHLPEHGNIPGQYRQAVPRRFDQRQAESLAQRSREQTTTSSGNAGQVLVADAIQPEQSPMPFMMAAQPSYCFRNISPHFGWQVLPALLADNDKIRINTFAPQPIEGLDDLQVRLTRLDRSDCKKRGPLAQLFQRSEERRVGKECRSRWWTSSEKKSIS